MKFSQIHKIYFRLLYSILGCCFFIPRALRTCQSVQLSCVYMCKLDKWADSFLVRWYIQICDNKENNRTHIKKKHGNTSIFIYLFSIRIQMNQIFRHKNNRSKRVNYRIM